MNNLCVTWESEVSRGDKRNGKAKKSCIHQHVSSPSCLPRPSWGCRSQWVPIYSFICWTIFKKWKPLLNNYAFWRWKIRNNWCALFSFSNFMSKFNSFRNTEGSSERKEEKMLSNLKIFRINKILVIPFQEVPLQVRISLERKWAAGSVRKFSKIISLN